GDLRKSVKSQADYWQVVAVPGWEKQYSIVPVLGDGSFASSISTNTVLVDNQPKTLGEFHAKLRDLTETPLRKNLLFPGLADTYNKNSSNAQRTVFETGIVRPLVEASRQKMRRD